MAKSIDGTFVECDVTRRRTSPKAVDTAVTTFGLGLDCFVGNAGIGGVHGEITDLDEEGTTTLRRRAAQSGWRSA